MKRLLFLLAFAMCISVCEVCAQQRVQLDSIAMKQLHDIHTTVKVATPRYKMYPTQNINILLKLDTATGRVWMVQYGTGDNIGLSVPVDDSSLLYSWDTIRAGRFELYPTQNMYNFILLDTQMGFTYQIQWHVDPDSRMRVRIF